MTIDWALAGQYTVWAILTGVAVYLWILLADAANRADERDWERQTLRTILKYTEKRKPRPISVTPKMTPEFSARIYAGLHGPAKQEPDVSDCANEPDLEFQLRRSVEIAAEKNDLGRAS